MFFKVLYYTVFCLSTLFIGYPLLLSWMVLGDDISAFYVILAGVCPIGEYLIACLTFLIGSPGYLVGAYLICLVAVNPCGGGSLIRLISDP